MSEKIISKEDLWESAKKMSKGSGKRARDTYDALRYLLGSQYWTHDYASYPDVDSRKRRNTR